MCPTADDRPLRVCITNKERPCSPTNKILAQNPCHQDSRYIRDSTAGVMADDSFAFAGTLGKPTWSTSCVDFHIKSITKLNPPKLEMEYIFLRSVRTKVFRGICNPSRYPMRSNLPEVKDFLRRDVASTN